MSSLPEIVNEYFALDARRDHGAILGLFADDAVVVDEGQTMTGRDAIRSWREGAVSKYSYTTEIVGAEQLAPDRVLVRGRITGDFPGGTADLGWDFTLDEGRITQLVIAPERRTQARLSAGDWQLARSFHDLHREDGGRPERSTTHRQATSS